MSPDLLERLEQPEYTGENRCGACTAVNLLLAAALAALLGRRNRALGLLAFVGGAALVYLRGYLVPGTPELTKAYLPPSVLALFGNDERPASMDPSLARRAADRTGGDDAVAVDVRGPDTDGHGVTADADDGATDADDGATDADYGGTDGRDASDGGTDGRDASDGGTDGTEADDRDGDEAAEGPAITREDVEALLQRPMDEVLEAFEVVEEDETGEDLVLVDSFRAAWEAHIDALAEDEAARRAAFAAVVDRSADDVVIEQREDGRYYALVEGRSAHNWITEAALQSDLAAHSALEDPRWDVLEPAERLSVLRGFRVFLTTCPDCGGPVSATDDVVESCCGSWDVVAVECGDCDARVLEIEAPEEAAEPDAVDPRTGGFTR
jgi:hypothetical protein